MDRFRTNPDHFVEPFETAPITGPHPSRLARRTAAHACAGQHLREEEFLWNDTHGDGIELNRMYVVPEKRNQALREQRREKEKRGEDWYRLVILRLYKRFFLGF
jgi:hypothetical protein